MEIVKKYFPDLPAEQCRALEQLWPLYQFWNQRVNVISRKDIAHFYVRHVLHSLAVCRVIQFREGTGVLDVGTGGGFPGIPLAICYPDVQFTLVDSVGKKIKVVDDIVRTLKLNNVQTQQIRAERLGGTWDFIVSRAVKPLPLFVKWTRARLSANHRHTMRNGILYLKGGDVEDELHDVPMKFRVIPLSGFFEEDFFETKKIVYLYE